MSDSVPSKSRRRRTGCGVVDQRLEDRGQRPLARVRGSTQVPAWVTRSAPTTTTTSIPLTLATGTADVKGCTAEACSPSAVAMASAAACSPGGVIDDGTGHRGGGIGGRLHASSPARPGRWCSDRPVRWRWWHWPPPRVTVARGHRRGGRHRPWRWPGTRGRGRGGEGAVAHGGPGAHGHQGDHADDEDGQHQQGPEGHQAADVHRFPVRHCPERRRGFRGH